MENCSKVAQGIVNSMTTEELEQFVYEDILSLMLDDQELFIINLEKLECYGFDITK